MAIANSTQTPNCRRPVEHLLHNTPRDKTKAISNDDGQRSMDRNKCLCIVSRKSNSISHLLTFARFCPAEYRQNISTRSHFWTVAEMLTKCQSVM